MASPDSTSSVGIVGNTLELKRGQFPIVTRVVVFFIEG